MVSVSNIKGVHRAKLTSDGGNVVSVVNDPQGVAEAIDIGYEIKFGLTLSNAVDESHQNGVVFEGEKSRTYVGIGGKEMLHAIIFLVATCEFVLFDETIVVVVNMSGEHDAVLGVPVHRLGIEVIARLLILYEPTLFDEMGELSLSFGINT